MDDHLVAFGGDEHDDFKEVGSAVRSDDQPSIRVLAKVVENHRMFDGVEDVFVTNAVTASGRMDLHTAILYYESRRVGRRRE